MKLPIKKKYFDLIKSGDKVNEYRDAHITFVCEETGETVKCEVEGVHIDDTHGLKNSFPDIDWEDDNVIVFELKKLEAKHGR